MAYVYVGYINYTSSTLTLAACLVHFCYHLTMLHQLLSVFDLLESFDLGVSVETRLPQCYQMKGVLCAVQEREDTPLVTEPVWNTQDDRDGFQTLQRGSRVSNKKSGG